MKFSHLFLLIMLIELTSATNGNTIVVNTEMIEMISRIKNCDTTAITLHHHSIEVKEDVYEIMSIVACNNK